MNHLKLLDDSLYMHTLIHPSSHPSSHPSLHAYIHQCIHAFISVSPIINIKGGECIRGTWRLVNNVQSVLSFSIYRVGECHVTTLWGNTDSSIHPPIHAYIHVSIYLSIYLFVQQWWVYFNCHFSFIFFTHKATGIFQWYWNFRNW